MVSSTADASGPGKLRSSGCDVDRWPALLLDKGVPIAGISGGRSSERKTTACGQERYDKGAEMYLGHAHKDLLGARCA